MTKRATHVTIKTKIVLEGEETDLQHLLERIEAKTEHALEETFELTGYIDKVKIKKIQVIDLD